MSATAATTGSGPPQAPVLDTVGALHGALHVFWTNVTPDCDAIEIERMTASMPYALILSVPGDIEDQADDAATDTTVLYTYRLRCKKGDELSPYSNEDSRMPRPEP